VNGNDAQGNGSDIFGDVLEHLLDELRKTTVSWHIQGPFQSELKAIPLWPLGLQEVEAPRISKHSVVRISALRTGRLYPQDISLDLFLLEAKSTPRP
jgi:hypothetical protein